MAWRFTDVTSQDQRVGEDKEEAYTQPAHWTAYGSTKFFVWGGKNREAGENAHPFPLVPSTPIVLSQTKNVLNLWGIIFFV
jgi:hypothetical protein